LDRCCRPGRRCRIASGREAHMSVEAADPAAAVDASGRRASLGFRPAEGARLVGLMCVAEILCMAGFVTYSALLPRLKAEWGLTSAEAGIVSGVLFGGYILAAPLLTSLTERIDARRVYLVATVVAALGSLSFALWADGFWTASLAQALFGVG